MTTTPERPVLPAAPADSDSGKRKRRPSGRFECRLGLLLGVGGLIGSRLGHLWVAFDVFSQFTLQFGLVTAAFVVALVMPRAKLLTAFVLIILGLVGIGVWPHAATRYPLTLAAVPEGAKEIKVASFNSWYSNEQVAAVQAELERLDADVVTFIEVGLNKKPILAALKERYPYQVTCFNVDFCNLVILSKFPVADSEARVGWEGPPMMRAKMGPELGGLTVIAAHTIRFPHSRAQMRQVVALADLIETIPGRKLVMGDFNATPFSRVIETVVTRANLTRLTQLPSWPSRLGLPQVAIDHIFVSDGIVQTTTQGIGEPAGSDHYPIFMRIAVPLGR